VRAAADGAVRVRRVVGVAEVRAGEHAAARAADGVPVPDVGGGRLVETDACVRACRVDRATAGISSDSLLDPRVAGARSAPRRASRGVPTSLISTPTSPQQRVNARSSRTESYYVPRFVVFTTFCLFHFS
jgi:hypothetical protein